MIEHKLAHISQRQGNHARYLGVRKNTFDLRRAIAIRVFRSSWNLREWRPPGWEGAMKKTRFTEELMVTIPADVKRLRQLEQENGRLKKVVADLTLDIDILKEVSRKKW